MYNLLDILEKIISLFASSIALYIFFFQRDKIKTLFEILLNYSLKTTLSEITSKIDRLNDFSVNDKDGKHKILNLLHEIEGQLSGNKFLAGECSDFVKRLNRINKNPDGLNEPLKRKMTSELREIIKNLDIKNLSNRGA
jgi:hypothetical protein